MRRRPKDLMDLASMNPEQLTSTPTKQDLLNEEIQKLAMKRSRGLTTRRHSPRPCRMNEVCSSRSSSGRKSVFIGKMIRAKFSKDGNTENG